MGAASIPTVLSTEFILALAGYTGPCARLVEVVFSVIEEQKAMLEGARVLCLDCSVSVGDLVSPWTYHEGVHWEPQGIKQSGWRRRSPQPSSSGCGLCPCQGGPWCPYTSGLSPCLCP